MEKCMPRGRKEGLIYGMIICALTCIFMATMNISIGMGGVSKESILTSLKVFPLVFIIAMLVEGLIVGKIAYKLMKTLTLPTDSFHSQILVRTFFTVIGMSIIMTNVGGVLAGGFSLELIKEFPIAWPRNFCVVIFLELLIVQPIARNAIRLMHEIQEKREKDLEDNLS